MIFDKSATIQWGKGQSFQQMVLGKLDIHMQKNEVESLAYTILQKLKPIKDLNIKPHYKTKLHFKTRETKTVKEREILTKFVQGL